MPAVCQAVDKQDAHRCMSSSTLGSLQPRLSQDNLCENPKDDGWTCMDEAEHGISGRMWTGLQAAQDLSHAWPWRKEQCWCRSRESSSLPSWLTGLALSSCTYKRSVTDPAVLADHPDVVRVLVKGWWLSHQGQMKVMIVMRDFAAEIVSLTRQGLCPCHELQRLL